MFNDKRSKKLILIAHCVLNQNTKLDKCAHYPGAIKEAAELLLNSDSGIIQMPCPELLSLGLDREVEQGANPTVESEDTRIAIRMTEDKAQSMCREIVDTIIFQLEEYRKHGFDIMGLVGVNGSPTCGVETTWSDNEEHEGPGIFIEMLIKEFDKRNFTIRMKGIKALEPEEAVLCIKQLLHTQ